MIKELRFKVYRKEYCRLEKKIKLAERRIEGGREFF